MSRTHRLVWGLGPLLVAVILLAGLDQPIARAAAGIGPGTLAVLRFVTWFGQGGVVLVPAGLLLIALLWLRPRLPSLKAPLDRAWRGALLLFAAVAVAGLINDAIKLIAGRARPRLWLHGEISGFFFGRFGSDYQSFPSGHTATSVAAAVILGLLFPRWRPAFAGFALVIALSRVLLDAHYLSDVVAGAIVGAFCAVMVLDWLQSRHYFTRNVKK